MGVEGEGVYRNGRDTCTWRSRHGSPAKGGFCKPRRKPWKHTRLKPADPRLKPADPRLAALGLQREIAAV